MVSAFLCSASHAPTRPPPNTTMKIMDAHTAIASSDLGEVPARAEGACVHQFYFTTERDIYATVKAKSLAQAIKNNLQTGFLFAFLFNRNPLNKGIQVVQRRIEFIG
jgi:hypothetical protein